LAVGVGGAVLFRCALAQRVPTGGPLLRGFNWLIYQCVT